MLTLLFWIILALFVGTVVYLQHPRFGAASSGRRLKRIVDSPNWKNGAFQNLEHTPNLAEGYSMGKVLYEFFFRRDAGIKPPSVIPSVQTDLKNFPLNDNLLVWFGHSSYYFQLNGLRFLVDPVFSKNASPLYGTTKAFEGTNVYGVADMPDIDYLLISHDHYDHLDYATIRKLKSKVATVICGLGVGAHFVRWGFAETQIFEMDWNETAELKNGIKIHTVPARHFSGRSFKRNQSLWIALVIEVNNKRIFIGGDSGYGKHFKTIGKQFGPIDFALLESGQYNKAWHYIHCLPEEVLMVANDLQVKNLMPIHHSKFPLALHAWDEPMKELMRLNNHHFHLVTPLIGQPIQIFDNNTQYKPWWNDVG